MHFKEQTALYGDNHLVNLVNQKGYEKPVKDAYERAVEQLHNPKVHYTYYDFHHECKGMKFENVNDLVDTLDKKGHSTDDWFFYDVPSNKIIKAQGSVVRTNCMDCLGTYIIANIWLYSLITCRPNKCRPKHLCETCCRTPTPAIEYFR